MKTQEFIDTDLLSTDPLPATKQTSSTKSQSTGSSNTVSSGRAEINASVEQARQQILELRRQQEELERERQELEDLSRREEEFEHGKAEMFEELSRTITTIEQEEFELNKRATVLGNFRELYQDYTRQLDDIRETEWKKEDLKPQLSKAFSVLEAARTELNKGRAQLNFLGDGPLKLTADSSYNASHHTPATLNKEPEPVSFDFKQEVQRGFARSLPIILLALIGLIAYLLNGK